MSKEMNDVTVSLDLLIQVHQNTLFRIYYGHQPLVREATIFFSSELSGRVQSVGHFIYTMHRPNNNRNQSIDRNSRLQTSHNDDDDDSRSQIDSESSEEERSSSSEEEAVDNDNNDAEDYVKRLRKTGTADDVSGSALTTVASMLAVKTGVMYLARFGPAIGNKAAGDLAVDEDDIVGGAVVATKLTPSQQQMMNQMAPQASGAAAGGIAAPMMSVVVPTPLGSAMASSASATVRHSMFNFL